MSRDTAPLAPAPASLREDLRLVSSMIAWVERSTTLDELARPFRLNPRGRLANLLAAQGLFLLRGKS